MITITHLEAFPRRWLPPAQGCFHSFDLEDLHLGHHRQLVFASLGRYHPFFPPLPYERLMHCHLCLFVAKVDLILSNGIFHLDLNRSNLSILELPLPVLYGLGLQLKEAWWFLNKCPKISVPLEPQNAVKKSCPAV